MQYRLTKEDLVKVTGIVKETKEVTTKVRERLFHTRKNVETRIYLEGMSQYFRVMNDHEFQLTTSGIVKGDTAEIYIRPEWLVMLGGGQRNDVFHLNINGRTVIDLSRSRRNEVGIILVLTISIPLFIFLGIRMRRKARK